MNEHNALHASLRFARLSADQVRPLRTRVLRPHLRPPEQCVFAQDDLPDTAHFGLLNEQAEVVAVGTFFPAECAQFPGEPAVQLRGMCVAPALQGQGLGSRLLEGALGPLALLVPGARRVWCNARMSAAPFYEKLGFQRVGEPFEVASIGAHVVMWRVLNPALAT